MSVSLKKGEKISLSKIASDAGISSLTKVTAGLGWDVNRYAGGGKFDLDASAFLLGSDGKVRSAEDFIYFNHTATQGVKHSGDNTTGEGEGDDEKILVDLTAISPDVEKIVFTVTIYDAARRNQNFGMVENSRIHLVDEVTGTELAEFDLGEDFSVETAVVAAELYKHNGEWKVNAIGQGFSGGLEALCANYGLAIG